MASTDTPEDNKKFAEDNHADYPILSDADKKAAAAYGVLIPNRGMTNRWTFYIGPDGKILDIVKKVSVRTAGADTVAKLEELKVPKKK